jgi:hypothetical protein
VIVGQGISLGIALFIGLSDQTSNQGVLNHIIPFVIAPVVAIGFVYAWHLTLGLAAYSRDTQKGAFSVVSGFGLFGIACAITAWILAALLGGTGSLKLYQYEFTKRLGAGIELAALNGSADSKVGAAVAGAASGLYGAAQAEISGAHSGRQGKGVVYKTILSAAQALEKSAGSLQEAAGSRDEHLTAARNDLAAANEAIANEQEPEFRDAIEKVRSDISNANNIRLSNAAAGIGAGLVSLPMITDALAGIQKVVQAVEKKRVEFVIPIYEPISIYQAIASRPQPLPWITAIFIEAIPLILLGLLLALWRDKEEDDEDRKDDDQPPPHPPMQDAEPLPYERPTLVAAE